MQAGQIRTHLTHAKVAASSLLLALACAGAGAPTPVQPPTSPTSTHAPATIVIDGLLTDWPTGPAFSADGRYLYARVTTPEVRSLSGGEAIRLELDLDGSTTTGSPAAGAANLGVDLAIEFGSRANENRGRGPRIESLTATGAKTLAWQDIGLYAGPTHASNTFEFRLDRRLLKKAGLPGGADGRIRARVVLTEKVSDAAPGRDIEELAPGPVAEESQPGPVAIPEKPQGAVRLMSYNVLWGSPHRKPESFARIFKALKPDVILAQEWQLQGRNPQPPAGGGDGAGAAAPGDAPAKLGEPELEQWFAQHVAMAGETWTVECTDGLGVALITKLPLLKRGPQHLEAPKTTRWDFPIRLAAGVVQTSSGPLVLGTVHLKASGSLGSEEDTRRLAEAGAVNQAIRELARGLTRPLIVVAGDYNMNGTTKVIDDVRRGLDADGSDLEIAAPVVLGEGLTYTFVGQPDQGRPTAVRLDYFTYPGAALRVAQSFVLDTSLLAPSVLKAAGLEREDSWGSDHIPVVIDLVPLEAK